MTRTVGIVLLVLGAILLLFSLSSGGISFTTKEEVLDAGPVEITRDKQTRLPVAPWLGAGAVVAGVVVLAFGRGST